MQQIKDLALLENRLLIKRIKEQKDGGIEIPDDVNVQDAVHFKGLVACVGPDCKNVKEGDTVIYRDGYSKLNLEGNEYHVAREDHIVGIIKAHV